jgi:ApaG protein
MIPYTAVTHDIAVTVRPVYLDAQSDWIARKFVFAYLVRIENQGAAAVQLVRRRWHIRDRDGKVQDVEGEGVIGQQPILQPGEAHEYDSFAILRAPEGTMEGTYLMEYASGARFRVSIPLFHLRAAAN